MLKNLLDACVGAVGFWVVGYGIAYGNKDNGTEPTLMGDEWVRRAVLRAPLQLQLHLPRGWKLSPAKV